MRRFALISCLALTLAGESICFAAAAEEASGTPTPGPARPEFKESVILSSPGDRGPGFDPSDLLQVRGQSFDAPIEKASSLYSREWTFQGPANYGGKVMDLAVTPDDPDVLYAAYGTGGVWKSANSGDTWTRVTDIESANYVSSVAVAPFDADTVFVGLGTPGYTLELERGVLRSNDGGTTWTAIGPIAPEADAIFGIAIDPQDANHLIVATEEGALVTRDGGATWDFTLDFPGDTYNWWNHVSQVVGHPTNGNVAWVTHLTGIYKTTDGGTTWKSSSQGIGDGLSIVLAVSQSQPNILYAERENEEWPKMDVYRSTNGGDSWTMTTTVDYFHQGRYDMAIGVHPTNSNRPVLANVAWHESTDGGKSFVNKFWVGGNQSAGAPHADHLAIAWKPGDPSTVYSGNDGGVWRTEDGGTTWHKVDQGVQTNLSFNLGPTPSGDRLFLTSGDYTAGQTTTGSVNWGTYPGYEWQFYYVDPHDADTVYTADYTTRLLRTENGGFTRTSIDPCPGQGMRYDRTIDFDPVTPDVVYAGCLDLRKSTDRGDTWTSVSPQLTPDTNYGLIDFQVAPTDPDVIWVLSQKLWLTRDGGDTWSSFDLPAYPQDLAVDPEDPSVVYVSSAFRQFRRYSDWGANHEQLWSNLPNSTVRRIVVDPARPDRVLVATDVGIFVSDSLSEGSGSAWHKLGQGLPRVSYWDLDLVGKTVYASGQQGVWRYDLTLLPCSPSAQKMCVTGDRFEASVTWRDFDGNTGSGKVVPVGSDSSGLFWFFGADNWEMLIKVLDGCVFNDHYWVFAAATTTVEYELTISDTQTGESKVYTNPLGRNAPTVNDTVAFSGCGSAVRTDAGTVGEKARAIDPSVGDLAAAVQFDQLAGKYLEGAAETRPLRVAEKAEPGPCIAGDTTLCLADGKFELTVDWRDFDGNVGDGQVVPVGSTDSGLFWFFGPDNWEMLVKVLDGCVFNDHHWIYSAATTTVEYTLRVRDTATGDVAIYDNELGAPAVALADVMTLGGC